jgi:hypothetical protein
MIGRADDLSPIGGIALQEAIMKPQHAPALETQTFIQLVAKVKIAVALKSGVLDLKCPCGMIILPPTPVLPNLKDRQRGLMKSRTKRHLHERHGLSEHTIGVILKEAFS